jgi:hypothetical protein
VRGRRRRRRGKRKRREASGAHRAFYPIKSFELYCHRCLGIFVSFQLLFRVQSWRGDVFLYFKP